MGTQTKKGKVWTMTEEERVQAQKVNDYLKQVSEEHKEITFQVVIARENENDERPMGKGISSVTIMSKWFFIKAIAKGAYKSRLVYDMIMEMKGKDHVTGQANIEDLIEAFKMGLDMYGLNEKNEKDV